MIKLKTLLKEDAPGFNNRKFGDSLPTLSSVMNNHQSNENESVNEANPSPEQAGKLFDKLLKKQTKGNLPSPKDIEIVFSLMRKKYGIKTESVNEGFSSSDIKKAIAIAKKMGGNMTGAVKTIEKMKRGLSKDKKVEDALRLANESVNEASVKTGWKLYHVYDINSKLWREMKYDLRDQFDELVKIGEDYGVFQNAQGTFKALKQIKRIMDKI